MEQDIKQHVITPLKGICNAPSDLTCDDEQLAVCDGMVNVNGELQPIQQPAPMSTVSNVTGELKYIHNYNHVIRYLSYIDNKVYCKIEGEEEVTLKGSDGTTDFDFSGGVDDVVSIGNTIIVNTGDDTQYFKWSIDHYKYLGNCIPKPDFRFFLADSTEEKKSVSSSVDVTGMNEQTGYLSELAPIAVSGAKAYEVGFTGIRVLADKKTDFENAITGVYAEVKKYCNDSKLFFQPFFVRGALELYDGTYMYISSPQLMIPATKLGVCFYSSVVGEYESEKYGIKAITCVVFGSELRYTQDVDYTDYSDLISKQVIFISKPVDMYSYKEVLKTFDGTECPVFYSYFQQVNDNSDKIEPSGTKEVGIEYTYTDYDKIIKFYYKNLQDELTPSWLDDYKPIMGRYSPLYIEQYIKGEWNPTGMKGPVNNIGHNYDFLKRKTDTEIIEELNSSHIYYKLCEARTTDTAVSTTTLIKPYTLNNLTTQTTLQSEDYYGWTKLKGEKMFTLNRRLLLANVKRTFFEGFKKHVCVWYDGFAAFYGVGIYVRIETESGDRIVKTSDLSPALTYPQVLWNGYWFFYPDTRAKEFWIVYAKKGNQYYNKIMYHHTLTPSAQLNGAYCFENYPSEEYKGEVTWGDDFDKEVNDDVEHINNYVIQSEVDNPFSFNASSYVRVGSGDIIGIAGLTTALSQDAYKVSTTICFTTQGIWALLSNDAGLFVNIPPSFSREVCNNPESITMVDNAVFFTSARGLMCVSGASESNVNCVSNQLSGRGKNIFLNFIKECRIAYDYRSNKLILFKPYSSDDDESENVWIYDIASSTFSMKEKYLGEGANKTVIKPLAVIGDYPDNVIQDSDFNLYTLYNKPQRDDDSNLYNGVIESRPMKLDGSIYLKSLRRAKKIQRIYNDERIATNCKTFDVDTSSAAYAELADTRTIVFYNLSASGIEKIKCNVVDNGTEENDCYFEYTDNGYFVLHNANGLMLSAVAYSPYPITSKDTVYGKLSCTIAVTTLTINKMFWEDSSDATIPYSVSTTEVVELSRTTITENVTFKVQDNSTGTTQLTTVTKAKSITIKEKVNPSSTLVLYGSNDLDNWTPLTSLQGKPYRFFKYRIEFTNLKATDTYSGLLLDTQVRYTDKPH